MAAFPDLVAGVYEYKLRQWRQAPCNSNRASQLGADCERELVYWRTAWEQALEPDDSLKIIFQEGEKHETTVLADLRAAGFSVLEQQMSLEWREYQITGHIDASILYEGSAIPLDVKSMGAHIWDSCFRDGPRAYEWREVSDAFSAKPWMRKYLAQLVLYCLMRNAERSMLVCINKGTGALAQVNVLLDYDLGEFLLQRAERINAHVRAGTLPDRIPFDDEVCGRCPFYHVCLPDHVGRPPIAFLEEPEIVELLETRERHATAAADYDRADRRVKEWAKAQQSDRMAIGRFVVRRKAQRNGVRVEIQAT